MVVGSCLVAKRGSADPILPEVVVVVEVERNIRHSGDNLRSENSHLDHSEAESNHCPEGYILPEHIPKEHMHYQQA
jgi:hypothetical protein